ncbi:MAG: GntR family transcriptional regulator [Longicatena sp.]
MHILISNTSDKPLYEQIVIQIKNMIMNNTLQEGDPLPSMRLLAKELRISVITTKRAFEELEREGFIVSLTGKGSFVARKNMEFLKEQQLKIIEEKIQEACGIAKQSGISKDEIQELITLIYEEE